MLVDLNKQEAVDSNSNSVTSKFTAWSKHCCAFYDELAELLVERKFILAKDILKASALVIDIQIRSSKVPYNGEIIDMSSDLYNWISMSIRGHELKDLFAPLES